MSLCDIADYLDVDAELLVHQDVPESPNLRPGDLRARAGDLIGKVVHCFTNDLEVPLSGVHLDEDVDV